MFLISTVMGTAIMDAVDKEMLRNEPGEPCTTAMMAQMQSTLCLIRNEIDYDDRKTN